MQRFRSALPFAQEARYGVCERNQTSKDHQQANVAPRSYRRDQMPTAEHPRRKTDHGAGADEGDENQGPPEVCAGVHEDILMLGEILSRKDKEQPLRLLPVMRLPAAYCAAGFFLAGAVWCTGAAGLSLPMSSPLFIFIMNGFGVKASGVASNWSMTPSFGTERAGRGVAMVTVMSAFLASMSSVLPASSILLAVALMTCAAS